MAVDEFRRTDETLTPPPKSARRPGGRLSVGALLLAGLLLGVPLVAGCDASIPDRAGQTPTPSTTAVSALPFATIVPAPTLAAIADPTPTSTVAIPAGDPTTAPADAATPAPRAITPTTKPTPTGRPTPTPKPTPRLTPALTPKPATGCDATFAQAPSKTSDQSGAIASFLRANAGKRVCFASGAVYRVDARIELVGWTGTIYGHGATFKRYAASTSQSSHLRIVQGKNIVVDGLNITGPATLANVQNRVFGSDDRQDQAAFSVETTSGFTLRNATIHGTWGDGVDLRPRNASGVDGPTTGVLIANVKMDVIGRNGIGLISVNGATITGVSINHAALHAIDGEPNRSSDVLKNIVVEGCNLRNFDYGHTPSGEGYAVVLTPAKVDVQPTNIVIRNNIMDKGRVRVDGYSSSRPASNVSITGNRPFVASTAYFNHVRGFIFSNNGLMTPQKVDVG